MVKKRKKYQDMGAGRGRGPGWVILSVRSFLTKCSGIQKGGE
jgi:hypothetical protein